MNKILDLKDYIHNEANIYSGRNQGKEARVKLKIEEKDTDEHTYNVQLNRRCILFASSFFLGVFGDSVRKLTPTQFKKKYVFDLGMFPSEIADRIKEDIEYYIQKASKEVMFYV